MADNPLKIFSIQVSDYILVCLYKSIEKLFWKYINNRHFHLLDFDNYYNKSL